MAKTHQPRASTHRISLLDPYGDGDCFFHAMVANVVAKALNNTLSERTQRELLASGFIQEVVLAARRFGIRMEVDTSNNFLTQLFSVFLHIQRDPNAEHKTVNQLLSNVHWGVWQKLSGEAARRVANQQITDNPALVKHDLYKDFARAMAQRVLQAKYPAANLQISSEFFGRSTFDIDPCQQFIQEYCQRTEGLFPENCENEHNGTIDLALSPLDAIANGEKHNRHPAVDAAMQNLFDEYVFPQWLAQHANNDNLNFEYVGNPHKKALSHSWQVNVMQVPVNKPVCHENLEPLNDETLDPSRETLFIVQRRGAHYKAGIECVDQETRVFVNAMRADKRDYVKNGGIVISRFDRTKPIDDTFHPKTQVVTPPKPISSNPLVDAVAKEDSIRSEVARGKFEGNEDSATKLQIDLDAEFARYINEHQTDDIDDDALEEGFYQQLTNPNNAKNTFGELYQRLSLFANKQHGLARTESTPQSSTRLDESPIVSAKA